MRLPAVTLGIAVAVLGMPSPALGQGLMFNARAASMAGASLTLGGSVQRYNPAYRAIPRHQIPGQSKITIPGPIGLVQFLEQHPISRLSSDPMFNPDSAGFNPIALVDLILNPPIFYELRPAPLPNNDVAFGIGKDSLSVNLGATQHIIPADEFGIAGSSRPLDIEPSFHGFHAGIMMWLHDEVRFQLNDSLLAFLKEGHPAEHNTVYGVQDSAIAEGGVAPSIGYSGRIYGNDNRGLYFGVSAHYYIGAVYGTSVGFAGITTGDTIFAGPNPVTPSVNDVTGYSRWGNRAGHGYGGDVGFAWVSGPLVIGFGVSDIGATITWPDTRIDSQRYDTAANRISTYSSVIHVESKTKLPTSYLANLIYNLDGTTIGADVLDNGLGTTLHVGVEQRIGILALRGGIGRDERKLVQFGAGVGIRIGPMSLDAGVGTHSNALSDQRGMLLATSLSIY